MRETWTPRPKLDRADPGLDLGPEEGFLLSRLDGHTTVRDVRTLTGFSREKVESILGRLQSLGILEEAAEPRSGAPDAGAPRPADGPSAVRAASWRRIFEERLRPLDPDVRVERAAEAEDEILRAFCFDPSRRVIEALLENPRFGLEHARLVARHHRSSQGLDLLGDRPSLVRDAQVERHLFRNSQTSHRLLRRIFRRARMAKIYRLAIGHDATEHVRELARRDFRKAFSGGTAEERAKLILESEGRCLALLTGMALDAKTAGLLRSRALTSTLLVRNLTRWPATPPPVLAHLMRQPQVRRSPALRNLILRHPNAPAELKREL